MNLNILDGPPGAGKTSTGERLRARGYLVFDIDLDMLAQPVNNATNKVTPTIGSSTEWHAQHSWRLKQHRMPLLRLASINMPVFLSGTITDNSELWEWGDTLTYLKGTAPTIRHRLATRKNHTFGQIEAEQDLVVGNMGKNLEQAVSSGALIIDASLPIEIVTDIAEINAINNFKVSDPGEVSRLQEMAGM